MKFLDKFVVDTGYVITKNRDSEEMVDDKRIVYIPLWKWLLESC